MKIGAVIYLPGKGNFTPVKIGCPHGDFIKTDIAGEPNPLWIVNGKVYTDPDEFNEVAAKVIPAAYSRDMRLKCCVKMVRIGPRAGRKPSAQKASASKPEAAPSEQPKRSAATTAT